jgi:hypothetical protein
VAHQAARAERGRADRPRGVPGHGQGSRQAGDEAELDGTADESTPRDGKGFYLLAATRPGYAREVRSGTPSADAQELAQLDVEGAISHEDYLAATKQVRVVSEEGFLRLVARKPHLLPALRRAVRLSRAASVSLKLK